MVLHGLCTDISTVAPIQLDVSYENLKAHTHDLEVPDLYDINYASFPTLEHVFDDSVDDSLTSSIIEPNGDNTTGELNQRAEEDVWHLADILGPLAKDVNYLSWEAFSNVTHKDKVPLFLSESGPAAFDAALQIQADNTGGLLNAGRPVQSVAFLRSMWHLSCGRASVMFPFDPEKKAFFQALDDGRLSGYSLVSSRSIVAEFLQAANATVDLRQFVVMTYSSRVSCSGLISLASAVSTALDAIENYLVSRGKAIQSVLQLRALLECPRQLLHVLKDVANVAVSAKTNEELLSIVFSKAQKYNMSRVSSELMMNLVSTVSQPWLSTIEEQIGLCQTFAPTVLLGSDRDVQPEGDSFTTEGDAPATEEGVPLLSKADQNLVSASSRCLNFMKEHHADHPLCKDHSTSEARKLELTFDLTDVKRIESKARRYYDELHSAIENYDCDGSSSFRSSGSFVPEDVLLGARSSWPTFDDQLGVVASAASLDNLPSISALRSSDEIFTKLTNILEAESDQSANHSSSILPFSLLAHLCLQPFLAAQHSLLSTASLRSIVLKHSIRSHLDLCHAFHLCSSGFFASRLSSVLFDPCFESVERQRNTLRSGSQSMGLKLGSGQRREWPPASSELRLALRGVLNDSWSVAYSHLPSEKFPTREGGAISRTFEAGGTRDLELPGGLSFTLRTDLKPDEIDRVLDPDSVYALDFLALSYAPGRALENVFPATCLDMYSRIFRLMLRMLRMNFVVSQIFRNAGRERRGKRNGQTALIDRFRQESTYFITTLTSYFVHTGIGIPWTRFQTYFDDLEHFILHDTFSTDKKTTEFTMDSLTQMHETTLRTITTSLFLRNKQRKAAAILESICNAILQFARLVGGTVADPAPDSHEVELRTLYARFKEHHAEFVAACRLLGERAEFGGRKGRDGDVEQGTLAVRELVGFL